MDPTLAPLQGKLHRLLRTGSADRPVRDLAPDALVAEIVALLDDPGFARLPVAEQARALYQIHLIYSGSWDAHGQQVIAPSERALAGLLAAPVLDLHAMGIAYDLLYFLYWCWGTTAHEQRGFGSNVVAPFAAAIRRDRPRPVPPTGPRGPAARVGLLAQFVTPGPGNAIAGANRVVLETLARSGPGFRPVLYAWMFHDPATLESYRAMGVEVRAIAADSLPQRVALLEDAIAQDRPDVLLTDMNSAVPTVLFERRVAPIQVFYQFGMPIWPLTQVDGVFRCWDFDPAVAGFRAADCTSLMIPYDVTRFVAPPDPAAYAQERALLPAGRLIGTYGRLAKLTPEFLAAVAAGIEGVPDVTVVLGGSGDATPIHAVLRDLGVAERFHVADRYVDGHLWGHAIDVFLDSFPQSGGASCLEMVAKGKPVVSLATPDAPNLALHQRAPSLVARDPADYAAILAQLLRDPAAYAQASEATRRLGANLPTLDDYARRLRDAITGLRERETAAHAGPMRQLRRWRDSLARQFRGTS